MVSIRTRCRSTSTALIAEAGEEGISEDDIEESGLDIPALIEAALKNSPTDEADPDEDD